MAVAFKRNGECKESVPISVLKKILNGSGSKMFQFDK